MKISAPLLLLQIGYVFCSLGADCDGNDRCATEGCCAALKNFWDSPRCICYGSGDLPHHVPHKQTYDVSEQIVANDAKKWYPLPECRPDIGRKLGANTGQKNTIMLLGDDIDMLKDVMLDLKNIPGNLAVKFYLERGDTDVNIGEIRTDYWSLLQCLGFNYCFYLKPSRSCLKIKVFPRSAYGEYTVDNNGNKFSKGAFVHDQDGKNYYNERKRNNFRENGQANDNSLGLKNHDVVKAVDKDGDGTVDYFYADLQHKDIPEKNKNIWLIDLTRGLNDMKFQNNQRGVDHFHANLNLKDDEKTNYEVAPGEQNYNVGTVKNFTLSPLTNINLPEIIYLHNISPYNYVQYNNDWNIDYLDSNKKISPLKYETVDLRSDVFDKNINLLNRYNSHNEINTAANPTSHHYKEYINVKPPKTTFQLENIPPWSLVADPNKYGFEVTDKKFRLHTDLPINSEPTVDSSYSKMPKSQIFKIDTLSTLDLSQIYEPMSKLQTISKDSYPTACSCDSQVHVPESSKLAFDSLNLQMPMSQDPKLTSHTLESQTPLLQCLKPTSYNSNIEKALQDPHPTAHSVDSQELTLQNLGSALTSFNFQKPFSHDSCPTAYRRHWQTLNSRYSQPTAHGFTFELPIPQSFNPTSYFNLLMPLLQGAYLQSPQSFNLQMPVSRVSEPVADVYASPEPIKLISTLHAPIRQNIEPLAPRDDIKVPMSQYYEKAVSGSYLNIPSAHGSEIPVPNSIIRNGITKNLQPMAHYTPYPQTPTTESMQSTVAGSNFQGSESRTPKPWANSFVPTPISQMFEHPAQGAYDPISKLRSPILQMPISKDFTVQHINVHTPLIGDAKPIMKSSNYQAPISSSFEPTTGSSMLKEPTSESFEPRPMSSNFQTPILHNTDFIATNPYSQTHISKNVEPIAISQAHIFNSFDPMASSSYLEAPIQQNSGPIPTISELQAPITLSFEPMVKSLNLKSPSLHGFEFITPISQSFEPMSPSSNLRASISQFIKPVVMSSISQVPIDPVTLISDLQAPISQISEPIAMRSYSLNPISQNFESIASSSNVQEPISHSIEPMVHSSYLQPPISQRSESVTMSSNLQAPVLQSSELPSQSIYVPSRRTQPISQNLDLSVPNTHPTNGLTDVFSTSVSTLQSPKLTTINQQPLSYQNSNSNAEYFEILPPNCNDPRFGVSTTPFFATKICAPKNMSASIIVNSTVNPQTPDNAEVPLQPISKRHIIQIPSNNVMHIPEATISPMTESSKYSLQSGQPMRQRVQPILQNNHPIVQGDQGMSQNVQKILKSNQPIFISSRSILQSIQPMLQEFQPVDQDGLFTPPTFFVTLPPSYYYQNSVGYTEPIETVRYPCSLTVLDDSNHENLFPKSFSNLDYKLPGSDNSSYFTPQLDPHTATKLQSIAQADQHNMMSRFWPAMQSLPLLQNYASVFGLTMDQTPNIQTLAVPNSYSLTENNLSCVPKQGISNDITQSTKSPSLLKVEPHTIDEISTFENVFPSSPSLITLSNTPAKPQYSRKYQLAPSSYFTFNKQEYPSNTRNADDSLTIVNSVVPNTDSSYETTGVHSTNFEYDQNNIASTEIYEPKVILNPLLDIVSTTQPSIETRYNSFEPISVRNPYVICPANGDLLSILNRKTNTDVCPANPEAGFVCPLNENYDNSPLKSKTKTVLVIPDTCPANHGPGFICPLNLRADYNNPKVYRSKSDNVYSSSAGFIVPDVANPANEKPENINPWTKSPTRTECPYVCSDLAFLNVGPATSKSIFISPLNPTTDPISDIFLVNRKPGFNSGPLTEYADFIQPLNAKSYSDSTFANPSSYGLYSAESIVCPRNAGFVRPLTSVSPTSYLKDLSSKSPEAYSISPDSWNDKSTNVKPEPPRSILNPQTSKANIFKIGNPRFNSVDAEAYSVNTRQGAYNALDPYSSNLQPDKLSLISTNVSPKAPSKVFDYARPVDDACPMHPETSFVFPLHRRLDFKSDSGNLGTDFTVANIYTANPEQEYVTPLSLVGPNSYLKPNPQCIEPYFTSHYKVSLDKMETGSLTPALRSLTKLLPESTYIVADFVPSDAHVQMEPSNDLKSSINPMLKTGDQTQFSHARPQFRSQTQFNTAMLEPAQFNLMRPKTVFPVQFSTPIPEFRSQNDRPAIPEANSPIQFTSTIPETRAPVQFSPAMPEFGSQTQFSTAIQENNGPISFTSTIPETRGPVQFSAAMPEFGSQTQFSTAIQEDNGPISFTSTILETRDQVHDSAAMPEFNGQTQLSTSIPERNGPVPFTSKMPETRGHAKFSAAMQNFGSQTQFSTAPTQFTMAITDTDDPSKFSAAIPQLGSQAPFGTDAPLPEAYSPIQFTSTIPGTHFPSTEVPTTLPYTGVPTQSTIAIPDTNFLTQFTLLPKTIDSTQFTLAMPKTVPSIQFSRPFPKISDKTKYIAATPDANDSTMFSSIIPETYFNDQFTASMPDSEFLKSSTVIPDTNVQTKLSMSTPEVSGKNLYFSVLPKSNFPRTTAPSPFTSTTQEMKNTPEIFDRSQFFAAIPEFHIPSLFTKTIAAISATNTPALFNREMPDIQYTSDIPEPSGLTRFKSALAYNKQPTQSTTGLPEIYSKTQYATGTPKPSALIQFTTEIPETKFPTTIIPETSENNVSTQFTSVIPAKYLSDDTFMNVAENRMASSLTPASAISTTPTIYSYTSIPTSYSVETPVFTPLTSLHGPPNSQYVDINHGTPVHSESLPSPSSLSRPHFSSLFNAESQSTPLYSTAVSYPSFLSPSEPHSSFLQSIITRNCYSNTLPQAMSPDSDVSNRPATNKHTLLSILPSRKTPLLSENTITIPSTNNKIQPNMVSYGSVSTVSPVDKTYNPIESIIRRYGTYPIITEPNRGTESHGSSFVTVSPIYETKLPSNSAYAIDGDLETKLMNPIFLSKTIVEEKEPSLPQIENNYRWNIESSSPLRKSNVFNSLFARGPRIIKPTHFFAPDTFASTAVSNQDVLTYTKPYAFTENTDNAEISTYDQVTTDPQVYISPTPISYQFVGFTPANDNLSQNNNNPINVVSTKVSVSDPSYVSLQGTYNSLDEYKFPLPTPPTFESTFKPFSTIIGPTFESLSIPTNKPSTPTNFDNKWTDNSFVQNSVANVALQKSYYHNYNPYKFYMKPRTMTQNTVNSNDIPIIEPEVADLENILQDLPKKLKYELQNYIDNKLDNINDELLNTKTLTANLGSICYGKYIPDTGITYPTDNPKVLLKAWYSVNTIVKPTLILGTEQRRTLNFIPFVESRYIPYFKSPDEIQDIAKQYITRYFSQPYSVKGVYSAEKPYAPINISNTNGISILWPTFCSGGCNKAGCWCQWK